MALLFFSLWRMFKNLWKWLAAGSGGNRAKTSAANRPGGALGVQDSGR